MGYTVYVANSSELGPWEAGAAIRQHLSSDFSKALTTEAAKEGLSLLVDGAYTSNPATLHALWAGTKKLISVTSVEDIDKSELNGLFGDTINKCTTETFYQIICQTFKIPYPGFNLA